MKLKIKVVPGASKDEIAGWLGDELKVRVAAAPEKGKANKAVVKLLAECLAINSSDIEVVSGATSPRKVVQVNMDEVLILGKLPPRTN